MAGSREQTDEHLATGWESDVPIGDTVLRRYLHHWASLCEAFAGAAGGRAVTTPAYAVADYRRPSGYFNSATLLRPPDPATFDETVSAIEDVFAGGTGEALLWSAWPTPDLRPRGWRLEGHPPLLIRPPASLVMPPARPDVDVRRVADTASLHDWERVAVEGFPMPELDPVVPGALAATALLDDDRLRFLVGYEDGRAVSLGTSFVDLGLASLALGVTRPEARRGGHWLRHAVERLWVAPDLWTAGVFSDFSRPGAERLGFVPVQRFTLWVLERPA